MRTSADLNQGIGKVPYPSFATERGIKKRRRRKESESVLYDNEELDRSIFCFIKPPLDLLPREPDGASFKLSRCEL